MVAGEGDIVCPVERAKVGKDGSIEGGLEGGLSRVVVVRAGHWVQLEWPQEVNETIRDFLDGGVEGVGTVKAVL